MKKLLTTCLAVLIVFACKHEIVSSVTVPSNLIYVPSSTTIVKGTAGKSVAPTINNGGGGITYNITSTAVAGISIDSSTGIISWTAAVTTGTYSISVSASNSIGITATTYTLIVNSGLTAPLNLVYAPSSSTIAKGTAGNSSTPSINNGGAAVTFSLTGTVPAGITINNTTGVISWSTSVAAGTYTLTISASNSVGSTTATYTLNVNNTSTVVAPTSFLYTPASSSVAVGTAGTSATPSINNGLGTITYSITSGAPSGVTINSATGIISWSTTVAVGTYTLTITATNSAGSISTTYSLAIQASVVNGTVCFSTQILPLYNTYCAITGCHDAVTKRSGVELDSYTTIMRGIKANNPNSSSYFTIIGGSMPPRSSGQMNATQIALIKQWINEGATNTTCATSTCDTTQYTYTNGISTLFANNCNGCHGTAPGSGNVVLSDYASAKTAGTTMKAAFLSAISYTSATSAMNMPPSGQLSSCQVTQITKWLNAGCPQ